MIPSAFYERARAFVESLLWILIPPGPRVWGWIVPVHAFPADNLRVWGRWSVRRAPGLLETWIHVERLNCDGSWTRYEQPWSATAAMGAASETEVRESVLPDPDAQDGPCSKYMQPSARPPLCARCAHRPEHHRDIAEQTAQQGAQEHVEIAKMLSARRGRTISVHDVTLVLPYDAESKDAPIVDVQVLERGDEPKWLRISPEEWIAARDLCPQILSWEKAEAARAKETAEGRPS